MTATGETNIPGFEDTQNDLFSLEEASELMKDLSCRKWFWEGFANKRRVQRYKASDDDMPILLQSMIQRLPKAPNQVIVEEHVEPKQAAPADASPEEVLTLFESNVKCHHGETAAACDCFVGQCVLLPMPQVKVDQTFHLPAERFPDCWRLQQHTSVSMEPRRLYLKTSDCLWEWRSCLDITSQGKRNVGKAILIKFVRLLLPDKNASVRSALDKLTIQQNDTTSTSIDDMPPLPDLLTIVITTSPIKSHPSTELLERTMETFAFAGNDFYRNCSKLIVCDGCRIAGDATTRKHSNVKQALRNGIATSQHAENYELFKERLKQKCKDNVEPFFNTTVLELQERYGYGFALKQALQSVETKYVCVIQHDRTFMRPTPIQETVHAMYNHPKEFKYVGMSMRSNLNYSDLFLSKYGKAAHDEFKTMVQRPQELALDKTKWGPNSESIREMMNATNENMRSNLLAVAEMYQKSKQYDLYQSHDNTNKYHQLSLVPTIFWYDNTHMVETAHYRDFIFYPIYKMATRGGFIEERTSPVIAKSCERLGLTAGHAKFGCYLLDDHSGFFFTGHLDGGSYLTQEQQRQEFGSRRKSSK